VKDYLHKMLRGKRAKEGEKERREWREEMNESGGEIVRGASKE